MEKIKEVEKSEKAKITVAILVVVLLFLFFLLWRQYAFFKKVQSVQAVRAQITAQLGQIAGLRRSGPLSAADTSYIQSWMTFDYVDTTFALPSSYLQAALDIHSPQYPHISIARYARTENLDATSFTTTVAGSVRTYLASSTPAASSTAR